MKKIYSISSNISFMDRLAAAILSGEIFPFDDPSQKEFALPRMTLLLPTRRAARAMQDAFLRVSGQAALLIPSIRPIGEADEDFNFLHSGGFDFGGARLDQVPPPISNQERHLVLTQMVALWLKQADAPSDVSEEEFVRRGSHNSAAEASFLARDLARLLDEAAMENVDLNALKTLVPEQYSDHWQQNLSFLSILIDHWPAYLKAAGLSSPGQWRNHSLLNEANILKDNPPKDPIIAAGSTGTIPAASELMKVISELPKGAVVLPGVDFHLEEDIYNEIAENHPTHPQFGLARLLKSLDVKRSDIKQLKALETSSAPKKRTKARDEFLSNLMRPADHTEDWQTFITDQSKEDSLAQAFENISLIKAANAPEEAEVVSLILRDAVTKEGQRAALITPDRILARRVAVRLEAWGLKVDDSAGRPLAKTMVGTFFDLIGEAIAQKWAAVPLLALLKHPFCQLGLEGGQARLGARALELICLRQPLATGGIKEIEKTYHQMRAKREREGFRNRHLKRLGDGDWQAALALINRLKAVLQEHGGVFKDAFKKTALKSLFEAHIKLAEHLSMDHLGNIDHLFSGEAGDALSQLLAGFLLADGPDLNIEPIDYPDFYRSIIAGESVRPLTPVHPRIFIWGPFESRLQNLDCVVLGGLNEASWPSSTGSDPWLSRPMRASLGLPQPEQKLGYEAHDFISAFAAKRVYLTRAIKQDGVPTVASRWVMRLETLLEAKRAVDLLEDENSVHFLNWAGRRDTAPESSPLKAPAPRPPLSLRPRRLSVTQIESWIANPYGVFAKHILKLEPLEPLDQPPEPRLKGQLLHQALADYLDQYTPGTCDHLEAFLDERLGVHINELTDHPFIAAFWRPRFKGFAKWFAETEPERAATMTKGRAEVRGGITLKANYKDFELTAVADRIDWNDTQLRIYDYKTGSVPTKPQVEYLYAPQLPLEALIAMEGGFQNIPKRQVSRLSYIGVKGDMKGGVETRLEDNGLDLEASAQKAKQAVLNLINLYDDETVPYKAIERAKFADKQQYDPYRHLARFGEWEGGRDDKV